MALDLGKKKNRHAELLLALRKDHKFDPLAELIYLYRHELEDPKDKMSTCKELMNFIYPKMKSIEIDHKVNNPVVFNFDMKGDINSEHYAKSNSDFGNHED